MWLNSPQLTWIIFIYLLFLFYIVGGFLSFFVCMWREKQVVGEWGLGGFGLKETFWLGGLTSFLEPLSPMLEVTVIPLSKLIPLYLKNTIIYCSKIF